MDKRQTTAQMAVSTKTEKLFSILGWIIALMLLLQQSYFPQYEHARTTSLGVPALESPQECRCTCVCPECKSCPVCKEQDQVKCPICEEKDCLTPPPPPPYSLVPSASRLVELENGRKLTIDDIVFGYDKLFETDHLFSVPHWLGVQNQQDPMDAMIIQDLVWKLKPDLFIEIGTNTGGGAVFVRTIMDQYNPDSILITIDPKDPGVSWDRRAKEKCQDCISVKDHPMWKKLVFLHGLSTDGDIIEQVRQYVKKAKVVMVNVDGCHSHECVYNDLQEYSKFVTLGSYIISQDTKLDRLHEVNGPAGATKRFMENGGSLNFTVDHSVEYFFYSQHLGGFLKRTQ